MPNKSIVLFERDINVSDDPRDTPGQKNTIKFLEIQPIGTKNRNSLNRNDNLNSSSIRDTLKRTNASASKIRRNNPKFAVLELKNSESPIEIKSIIDNDHSQALRKRKRFSEVSIPPQISTLSSDSQKFQISSDESTDFIKYAAPFNHCNEFDPYKKSDEGVLLSILALEFQKIDDEEDLKFDLHQEMGYVKPRSLISSIFEFVMGYRWLLDPFIEIDRNEYLRRYPWDKFYDPELYYENGINEVRKKKLSNDNGLNLDMMPDELKEEIILNHKTSHAAFRFTRQFN